MSDPASEPNSAATPPKKARTRVPKIVWDLVFTALIPILILSPNILGSGISVAEQVFGGGTDAYTRTFVVAALIPVGYVILDYILNRNVSPVALIGGAGALLTGALAFWFVDGFWYAIKDSGRSYITAVLFFISAFTSVPIFRVFLEAASIGEGDEESQATRQAMRDPIVHRGLVVGTVIYAVVDLIYGVINSFVNYARVTAEFGTKDFNTQVATVNAIMRVPATLITLLGAFAAIWFVQRAVRVRFGPEASLLEPAKLAAAMRERGEVRAEQRDPV